MRLRLLLGALVMAASASAADIDDIALKIAANNPRALAAIESAKAEFLRNKADNQLDAPEIEVEHLFGGSGVKDKTGVSLTQGFDWPGTYRARSEANKIRFRALNLRNKAELADIALEAKITILEIVYLKKRLSVIDSIAANVDKILSDTERGFAMGIYTRLDINRLKIEKLDISGRRNALLVRMDQLKNTLIDLNGAKPVDEIIASVDAYPIEKLESLDEYVDRIIMSDPTLACLKAESIAASKEKNATRLSRLPGWSIGYKYSREEGHDFNGFSIGMTLPFLSRNYSSRSADASVAMSEYEYQSALNRLTTEIAALYSEATRLGKAAADYAEVFEKSDNLRLLAKAYQGKQLSSVEYLNDVNYFLEGYESYLENAFSYAMALARLNRLNLVPDIDR